MAKITSANCVAEIVKLCANPRLVIAAYNGGQPSDYLIPGNVRLAMLHMAHYDKARLTTEADFIQQVLKSTTNPKNWKRMTKETYKSGTTNQIITERIFDCSPYDSQLRAYVIETNGQISDVYLSGE